MDAATSIAGVSGQANEGENLGNFAIRGYQAPTQIDGFDTLAVASGLGSTTGVDRIEVIKGPSAVFNGDAPPGGVMNIIYKEPSFTPETRIEGTYGSWNYKSGELFATGPLFGDKVAFLMDGKIKRSQGWVDYTGQNENTLILGATFQPTDHINLTLNYRNIENANKVSALPVSHQGFLTSGLPSDTDIISWVKQNYGPNEPPQTIVVPQYLPGGSRYNVNGPQNHSNSILTMKSAVLDYYVNDHVDVRDSFMYSDFTLDLLELQQSGVFVLGPGGVSGRYSGFQQLNFAGWGRENKLEVALHFNTGPISHAMLLGFQTEYTEYDYFKLAVGPPAVDSSGNPWNYFTDGPRLIGAEFNKLYPYGAPTILRNFGPSKTNAFYVAEQMSAYDDRIHVLLGVRNTANTTSAKVQDTTPQVGLLYKPFSTQSRFKDTALFANYSRSFTPSGLVDGFGNVVPPETGIGYEFGIKTDWFNGAVASTISAFRDDLTNLAIPNYTAELTNGGRAVYDLGGTERSEGIEAEIAWTAPHHFQLTGNVTWLPTATYLSFPQVPQQQGLRFPSTAKLAGNLIGKYSILSGVLNGVYVGGDIHAQTSTRGVLATDWTYAIQIPALVEVNAFVGYQTPLAEHNLNLRLNIKNVTDRRGFEMDNAFRPNDPISFYLTADLSL